MAVTGVATLWMAVLADTGASVIVVEAEAHVGGHAMVSGGNVAIVLGLVLGVLALLRAPLAVRVVVALGALVGAVMRATRGQANAAVVNDLLRKKLG